MKLLYVVTYADLGGAQRSTLLLAEHFQGEIAAGFERDELFEAAAKKGIKTHKVLNLRRGIKPLSDLLCLFELFRLFKKTKPDIVHLNSSKAGFIGSIAGKLAGVKVVYSARGFVFNEDRGRLIKKVFLLLEKFASRFRNLIITVSDFDRKAALAANLIAPERIVTVHNAINPVQFLNPDIAKNELGLPRDKKLLVTIANLYPNKGLDILIESLSLLPAETLSQIFLAIMGSGPEEFNLKQQTESLGFSKKIKFFNLPNAAAYLKAFDLFILPSRKEGFPLTLLEAMRAGLPIIATNVGGNPEAIGKAGILIDPGQPKILADAITRLLNEPSLAAQLSAQALIQAQHFQIEKMFSAISYLYQAVHLSYSTYLGAPPA